MKSTQSQWLKILKEKGEPAEVKTKFVNDVIYIYSDSADSFVIDFNSPVFKDVEGDITVMLNNQTTYIGKIPPSKILYIHKKVVLMTGERDNNSAILQNKDTIIEESMQLETAKEAHAPTNRIIKST